MLSCQISIPRVKSASLSITY